MFIYEAVYGDAEIESLIRAKWPDITIEDASDCIHEERFVVKSEVIKQEEFYLFAAEEGFLHICFLWRVWSGSPDNDQEWADPLANLFLASKNEKLQKMGRKIKEILSRPCEKCGGTKYLQLKWDTKGIAKTPCPFCNKEKT